MECLCAHALLPRSTSEARGEAGWSAAHSRAGETQVAVHLRLLLGSLLLEASWVLSSGHDSKDLFLKNNNSN